MEDGAYPMGRKGVKAFVSLETEEGIYHPGWVAVSYCRVCNTETPLYLKE